jgi:DnaJ family protein B protein 4
MPGFSHKTELKFNGDGNQVAGCKNADLIIKFKQVDSPNTHAFKRSGDDLILTHKISLRDCIEGCPIYFTTLDGRPLTCAVDETISPATCKQVPNEGMPNGKGGKGNLYIKFDIEFPTKFTTESKTAIVNALHSN